MMAKSRHPGDGILDFCNVLQLKLVDRGCDSISYSGLTLFALQLRLMLRQRTYTAC